MDGENGEANHYEKIKKDLTTFNKVKDVDYYYLNKDTRKGFFLILNLE